MEIQPPRSLTVWEAKERAGLLALETEEWREKRLIAEDPNTTADTLKHFSCLLNTALQNAKNISIYHHIGLLAEAVSAHPNTPPAVLIDLLNSNYTRLAFPAFCRNPITPFLALELPDFWQQLRYDTFDMREKLLREGNLPLAAVRAFTQPPASNILDAGEQPFEVIIRVARLHIALAGEVQSNAEGIASIRASESAKYANNYLIHIYRLHLRGMDFLRAKGYARQLREEGTSAYWAERLYVALQLPLSTEPFFEGKESDADWNRSPLDLLNHLARDGNRLVRWAAQTRLSDPAFPRDDVTQRRRRRR